MSLCTSSGSEILSTSSLNILKRSTVLNSEQNLLKFSSAAWAENTNLNIDPVSLFKEIEQELSESLFNQENGEDSTEGPLDYTENLTENLQTELDKTLREDGGKGIFLRSLTKVFAILLSTRANSAEKIKTS